VLGIQRNADAGLHVQAQSLQHERPPEGVLQLPDDHHGTLGGGDRGQQDGELVAAEPGDGVDRPQRATQPFADLHQQLVAVVVAEGVVDLFEAVQVDQQQGGGTPFPVGLPARLVDAVAQQGAVGQAGQRIGQRLPPDAALVTEQQQPTAAEQAQPDRERDRRGHHQRPAKPAKLGEAGGDLLPLVQGALGQPVRKRPERRFHLTGIDRARPRGISCQRGLDPGLAFWDIGRPR
jgi:hypothetical protein